MRVIVENQMEEKTDDEMESGIVAIAIGMVIEAPVQLE